jgi:CID domain
VGYPSPQTSYKNRPHLAGGADRRFLRGRHFFSICLTFFRNFFPAKDAGRKLTLLYFANDVVQNMRKKGPEYQTEFQLVLVEAFTSTAKQAKMYAFFLSILSFFAD